MLGRLMLMMLVSIACIGRRMLIMLALAAANVADAHVRYMDFKILKQAIAADADDAMMLAGVVQLMLLMLGYGPFRPM